MAKLKKKLQSVRIRRKETEERNKDKLQGEINQVLQACIERINLLQREDLDLYERRKLAIEFKDFVDKYVNAEYRDNFYQFINHILQKYRTEEQYNQSEEKMGVGAGGDDAPASGAHVEWPINCTHIKIAYHIWNNKKMRFSNPLEIAQMLRRYYYEETAQNENEYEMPGQAYTQNYDQLGLGGNEAQVFLRNAADRTPQAEYMRALALTGRDDGESGRDGAALGGDRFNSNPGF